MTVLVDYKAGNLTSVRNAFTAIGAETVVSDDPAVVRAADRIVFPGVGAAASAMANLKRLGLDAALGDAVRSGRPFLGICLGMQVLFEHSEEDGGVDLLGFLPGRVRRFPDVASFKVPAIGWNQVAFGDAVSRPRLSEDGSVAPLPEYYFVHSYYAEVGPYTIGTTDYAGVTFTSAVRKGNLTAYQFHPEKSGRVGLALLSSWLKD